jgi:GalNAc-alpha-(1->4)-GalNAc-alpha-(1->3)-diNAcBac-PP-undecaprenol alpha-1,4-N-acetyl-D-galactosaminyltransferase
MNVLLFARSYENMAGGIEKMSLLIAEGLKARGHNVVVVSIDSKNAESFYKWPGEVKWERISLGNANYKANVSTRLSRSIALRYIARENQIGTAIGFQVGAFALLKFATLGLGIKVIAAERNSPTLFDFIQYGKLKRFFSNLILQTASAIAVQFPNYRKYYPFYLRHKIAVTPNPVLPPIHIRQNLNVGQARLLFVGRLTYQKNLSVLIRALAYVNQPIRLTVIGQGPDYSHCKEIAAEFNLPVEFLPPTREISKHYLNSDFLILPSRWEGFPNVVAEALSFGLPVVGFQSCAGIPELIKTGVNGFVCVGEMNELILADGINQALGLNFDPKIVANSVSQYSHSNFLDCWENLL